jgi:asparagine synthase (glutamine-hydrolysing)
MCGFLGCINANIDIARAMRPLAHRGPDAHGEYEQEGLFLRHFRLAIIGAETTAHQPMLSLNGKLRLAFNGEIYNYKELAAWMGRPDLAVHGDTRVLVEFLSTYGLDRIDLLNGMFAFAAYFEDTGELYLVRDRFGVKPLYFVQGQGGVYFASEIKSLRSVRPFSLSRERVLRYLDAGAYPGGVDTFYEDIIQVEAGSWVCYRNGRAETHRWYDLVAEVRALQDAALSMDEYEDLLENAIRLRLRSDVPISLHYSAGTDSTALLLKTKEVWGWDFPLVTFTMAFDDPDVDESAMAEAYCGRIAVENHKVFLAANEVPQLALELHEFQDEPYGGVPTIAYYRMNQVERERGYIVSIEGQGGDEALGGYLYHVYLAIYDLYVSGTDPELLSLILKVHNISLAKAVTAAETLIAAGFQSHTDMTDLRCCNNAAPLEKFMDWLRTIQLHDVLVNKIPRTLRFNDRASMACGREVRFPLLDYRVLAYAMAFSHRDKYAGGHPKAPLREIIRRHMPGVFDAPKRSVVTPQTKWLRGELKPWAIDRVEVLRRSGFIPERAFQVAETFFRDPAPQNSFPLWQLINLSFFFDKA